MVIGNVNVVSGSPLFSEQTAMCGLGCRPFVYLGKARQGKFICIAHFIHSGNSKCFT